MIHQIFYSWQSDHPNSTNRGFIQRALEEGVEAIREDDTLAVEPVVDRDTQGLPGAPDIVHSIFEKIELASAVVCDVSIISDPSAKRSTPNPNVLVELGYALKALGHARVLLVMNTAYGEVKKLPFDLDHRRVVTYEVREGDTEKGAKRRELAKKLALGLRSILAHQSSDDAEEKTSPVELLEEYFASSATFFQVKRLVLDEAKRLCERSNALPVLTKTTPLSPEELAGFMKDCESMAAELLALFALGCSEGEAQYSKVWSEALSHLTDGIEPNRLVDNIRLYPALLFLYAGGISAVAGGKYENLATLLRQPKIRDLRYGGRVEAPAHALVPYRVIDERVAHLLPDDGHWPTPLSHHLFSALREALRSIILNDDAYEEAFLRFEYLFALACAADHKRKWGSTAVPVGSYIWERFIRKSFERHSPFIHRETSEEIARMGDEWPPLRDGVYDGPLDKFKQFKEEADTSLLNVIRQFYPDLSM
jgi:hypothetical protein